MESQLVRSFSGMDERDKRTNGDAADPKSSQTFAEAISRALLPRRILCAKIFEPESGWW